MSAFSAKVVQHSINQLLINTINDAEKMLLDLPRDGDRVEVITSSSHEVRSHSACGFGPRKTTQDVVVDTTSQMTPTPKSDELQRKLGYPEESTSGSTEGESNKGSSQAPSLPRDKPSPSGLRLKRKTDGERKSSKSPKKIAENAIKRVLPDKAEVVPGSIQVSPLRQMAGILVDLIVMIKMKSGSSRTVNMQIECPNFTPKRIRVDGAWHSIV